MGYPRKIFTKEKKKQKKPDYAVSAASQVAQWVKSPPSKAGDASLIPGLGRSPGGGHGNPL